MFLIKFVDLILVPFTLLSTLLMWSIRRVGLEKLYFSNLICKFVGVMPVRNHYYEPQFIYSRSETEDINQRKLNGINMNVDVQLSFLSEFKTRGIHNELLNLNFGCNDKNNPLRRFEFMNGSFEAGDAEIYYSFIRHLKPNKIIEIGSGNSTLVALEAARSNSIIENFKTEIICIEPFEMNWLEETNAIVIREKVESLDIEFFKSLNENDILFIDSSHIIRPNGDVLFNFLTILPILNKNVYIHIHDIFTPNNYPSKWIVDKNLLWNEQYIFEALLSGSDTFEIVMANNFLHQNHYNEFNAGSPFVTKNSYPGSFWIRKVK